MSDSEEDESHPLMRSSPPPPSEHLRSKKGRTENMSRSDNSAGNVAAGALSRIDETNELASLENGRKEILDGKDLLARYMDRYRKKEAQRLDAERADLLACIERSQVEHAEVRKKLNILERLLTLHALSDDEREYMGWLQDSIRHLEERIAQVTLKLEKDHGWTT